MKESKGTKSKKARSKRKLYIILVGVVLVIVAFYFPLGLNYQKVFFPATTINGVNVSGLDAAQAQSAINAGIGKYILTLEEADGRTEQITGSSIGLYAEDDDTLQAILSAQNVLTWGFQGFHEKEYSLNIRYEEEKLRSVISSLSCMDKNKWVSSEDAYISYEKGDGYQIVPEVEGNQILEEKLFDAISEAVCNLETTLSLQEEDLYVLPKISSEDSGLNEQLTLLQSYSDMTVTYQFGNQSEILDGDTISEWITTNKSGKRTIDRDAVAQYVKELAKKHNTAYSAKTLETSYGETVTIGRGYYGWMMDQETETDSLMEIIRQGQSVSKEPAYLMEAASHDGNDYGDTYVEINLTAQHLFYYKDGELVIESDFVSGNPSRGNSTPDGAYSITYKERNATLKGQNYSTPVSYWMPFNGNIGMHDSSWRSTFGGSIYQTNGSHGCINLPPDVAQTIFENIEQGIPVLCYHLGGTEQSYATDCSGEQVATEVVMHEPEPEIPLPPDAEGISILPEEGAVIPDVQIPQEEGIVMPDI